MTKLRVTADTNVLVSGIIIEHGTPFLFLEHWRFGRFDLVISELLLQELEEVLRRAKLEKYQVKNSDINNSVKLLRNEAYLCLPTHETFRNLRHPKDQIVLSTAIGGNADYLVTGDKDLLSLKNNSQLKSLRIVSVTNFLKILK